MIRAFVLAILAGGCISKPDLPPAHGVARSWHQRHDTVAPGQRVPAQREQPRLVYDPHRKRVLMYEGDAYGYPTNDTMWELDPAHGWQLVCDQCLASADPIGMGGRNGAALVYDPDGDRILLYGGTDVNRDERGELWQLDGNAWKLVQTSGDVPGPRWMAQMVHDPAQHGLWLLGGYAMSSPIYAETYLLRGTTWMKVEPGPDAIMASPGIESIYDPQGARILMREDANVYLDTLWEHRGGWTKLCDDCTGRPRKAASLVHIPEYDQTLLVGGFDDSGQIAGTQILVGDKFETFDATNPPGRGAPGIAYDPSRDVVVFYGGRGSGTGDACDTIDNCGDTWELVRD